MLLKCDVETEGSNNVFCVNVRRSMAPVPHICAFLLRGMGVRSGGIRAAVAHRPTRQRGSRAG